MPATSQPSNGRGCAPNTEYAPQACFFFTDAVNHGKKMKIRSTAQIRAISFPPDVYKALEVIAKQKKVSLAWVVREATDQYLSEKDARHSKARDITKLTPEELAIDLGLGPVASAIDVLVGGLPCQAFARVGRPKLREIDAHPQAFKLDPRARLYVDYL
jgi:site-specific DNA-cytosine methylase